MALGHGRVEVHTPLTYMNKTVYVPAGQAERLFEERAMGLTRMAMGVVRGS